ncbi:AAA family ATPase [Roseomonas haemaphysalidis]|uniref:AAA family ATPase n=1 Tax=Roseomonas haemaphysalidis TaxID=2768162 RepID=A0ABS3KRV8_9PROT|nr:AAA family ATPase [Roseomonas haemaphysalidis]MBO1080205.1 AAA family ATPase [Roseomonas haemaphysalidis]
MRLVIIGLSGAGKSTFARRLATARGIPHVELDALFWEAGWQPARPEVFAARVCDATAGPDWVVDGNYSAMRPHVWHRATHLLWLDYARAPIMLRVIRRSALRAVLGTPLWNGNRESWRRWLDRDHPIRWAWRQWRPRRRSLEAVLAEDTYRHLDLRRLRHPREAEAAFRALAAQA